MKTIVGSIPYTPGSSPDFDAPLGRFLPPVEEGVVAAWLREHVPAGSWVLDPFGASPQLAVEAARAGYRILVAANNPVVRFLLEIYANPPNPDELRAALAALAETHKEDERLEPHILSQYITPCAECGQSVIADAFIWERDDTTPIGRIYRCPHCGDEGEHPATKQDAVKAAHFSSSSIHQARALERVAPLHDPDRKYVEKSLEVYPSRTVYALFTLLNRLDGIQVPPERRKSYSVLLLAAFDQTNTLWPHPTAHARPKRLRVPTRYRENNVWRALEAAIEHWTRPGLTNIPLTVWPQQPTEDAGISVFEGRLKNLAELPPDIEVKAVVTAVPRPNQAFWTLSALWAAWLWGREGMRPFKGVLRRRRYDWSWHTAALHAVLVHLAPRLPPDTPMFGLLAETEPGLLAATLIAASIAGFDLQGVALRPKARQAQVTWRHIPKVPNAPPRNQIEMENLARRAARTYIEERGEPTAYLPLQAATLSQLVQYATDRLIPIDQSPAEAYQQTNALLHRVFTYRKGFMRYGGSEHALDIGNWWMREPKRVATPLADQVEAALVSHLTAHPGITFPELDMALCAVFPGLLTPERELIYACLESLGEQNPPESGKWELRPQEAIKDRSNDLEAIRANLILIGKHLEYLIEEGPPLIWKDTDGSVAYIFYIQTSAALGKRLFNCPFPPRQTFLVIPGGRGNLVGYKLCRDPRMAQAVKKGVRFLKFRHVRRLAENLTLTRENLEEQFSLDPLTYTSPQIQMM